MSAAARGLALASFLLTASAPPASKPPTLSAHAARADAKALYEGLARAHFDLYAHRDRAAYDAAHAALVRTLAEPMDLAVLRKSFQRFVAFGRVAHATLDAGADFRAFLAEGGVFWGLDVRVDEEGLFVAQSHGELRRGDRILAIEGQPTKTLLPELLAFVSADNPALGRSLLERGFGQYLWLALGTRERFRVDVARGNGKPHSTVLPALSAKAWRALPEAEGLFSLSPTAREAKVLAGGVAYLRPGPFMEVDSQAQYDNRAFLEFVDASFARFLKEKCNALVIDLRNNPGGDNSFSDPMIAWFATKPFSFAGRFRIRSSPEAAASNQARLDANPQLAAGLSGEMARRYAETPTGQVFEIELPKMAPRKGPRFTGPVFVLVDRYSYSNAVNVAALVQDYGFGTILGEKTTDLATTYGAMESFTLPNTGMKVFFPKAQIVRPSGALESDGVTPDVAVPSPRFPTRDVVLERALKHVRKAL